MTLYKFLIDAYVCVDVEIPDGEDPDSQESYEKAWAKAQSVQDAVDHSGFASLSLFDAYGIEDAETGDEIREVH